MSFQDYERRRLQQFKDSFGRATKTWDPAATAASQGAEVSTTVTVAGASVGDPVAAGHTSALGAATLHAQVTSANTVTVRLVNTTAAAVDLATGTLTVVVLKTPVY